MNYKRALVLAPHTDDGELGCGGAIAKFIESGTEVHYVAFSTCRRSLPEGWAPDTLEKEVKLAVQILGLNPENLILCDFDVRQFPVFRQEILEKIVELKLKLNPDIVLVPARSDIHQDHQVVCNEALRAFKNTTLLGYEMPWNNIVFNSNAFISLEQRHVEKKVQALQEYKSQLHRSYLNKEFLFSLARVRGVQAATEYAEAFEAIRLVF